MSPDHGPPSGGTPITITGNGFTGAMEVKFEAQSGGGSRNATSFTVNSDTSITAILPEYVGIADVVVVGPGGPSARVPQDSFGYGPIVEQMIPRRGPATGGTEVTLSGFGLEEATAVSFGSAPAVSFTANPDDSITAITPPGTPGVTVVRATVTTPEGPSITPSVPDDEPANYFSYGPTVTRVEPEEGPAAGGTVVTIHGSGFESPLYRCLCGSFVEAVQFGPAKLECGLPFGPAEPACAPLAFEVISDSEITVRTPPGTGVVDLGVRTAGGASLEEPAVQFKYEPVARVVDQTPASSSRMDCLARVRAAFQAACKTAKGKRGQIRARVLRQARKRKHNGGAACRARFSAP